MSKVKAIIPCAGLGSRMGMAPTKSKELLPDPSRWNLPLIDWHLTNCYDYDLDPVIITRKEKTDLIEYCKKNGIQCEVIVPGKEWAETVLKSQKFWGENNILLFPDSRFFPKEALGFIRHNLESGDTLSLGVFPVIDSRNWLTISQTKEDGHDGDFLCTRIFEKKSGIQNALGIGIVGFKKDSGGKLFTWVNDVGEFPVLSEDKASLVQLNGFIDLTRTGKVYKYE